ncbi:hypothetical protein KY290_033659 [Solanum tuberosum]|uniref:Aminotransferase-like plant mobile domain-containing protein n=1 Tax=Solanum tuberosum TaxID=4113 RepID=A0ABQ7U1C7_SOLTU|nr:hypothetical protein KY289_033029 [Solanum tuberosum]KAH0647672.1 hypothetical protein KY285_032920 [Solanum tuberosum]KAH0740616.1 hypothetical protein KY290_033659 [Solanum tuberosum]
MEEREEVMVSSDDEEGWSKWVDELKPLHLEIRKKAGIFEAERWCLETNTFIYHGEKLLLLWRIWWVDIEKALCEVHQDIRARKTNVGHHAWMEHFAGRGDHLEHVAFLILWLSRYVLLATSFLVVDRAFFPIAIHLSQVIPIALAPAVLASIYRDMSLLRQLIVSSAKNHAPSDSRFIEDVLNPNLRAPFQFVQPWAWERFTNLQPKPSSIIYTGEPRVARWHKVKKLNHVNPRSGIDSAAECFLWCPYVVDIVKNWDIIRFYKERDEYVVVGPNMGREIMAFAQLVRASELVGMDCVEQYNPHRVSMQFGFDQDVPDCVNHASDHIPKIAWTNYNRPIKDVNLYIPSRFIESDVSRRYLEW